MKDDLYEPISTQVEENADYVRAAMKVQIGLDDMEERPRWKSIDSAPKDGAEVMLYIPNRDHPIMLGYYLVIDKNMEGWLESTKSIHWLISETVNIGLMPTYWMPLPNPPVEF